MEVQKSFGSDTDLAVALELLKSLREDLDATAIDDPPEPVALDR